MNHRKIKVANSWNSLNWIKPADNRWYILISCYFLALAFPPLVLFILSSADYISLDLMQLLGLVGLVSSCLLLIPIAMTISRLRYDHNLLADTFSSFVEMMDNAVDMIFIRNKEGIIIEANQQACDYLDYSCDELKGMDIRQIDRDGVNHTSSDPAQQSWSYETEFINKSGDLIPVEVRTRRAQWIENENYVDMVRDISSWQESREMLKASTESLEQIRNKLEGRIQTRTIELEREVRVRIEAEDNMNRMRRFLFNMIDSMPSMIIAINESLKVTQWNQFASELTGISAKQALGRKLSRLIPAFADDINRMAKNMTLEQAGKNQHERLSGDYRGEKHLFDVMVYPLQHDNDKGMVIRVDDVTERVHIENTLIQTEKMLSLGVLAAGMAHEINNPLGAILQSCQNIQRRLFGNLARNKELLKQFNLEQGAVAQYLEEQRIPDFVEGIVSSGERAAEIVEDMLNFSKPGKGKRVNVDLQSSIEASLRLAASEFGHSEDADFKKIKLETDYCEQPLAVVARKNQLEQVFLNILLNAAQAISSKPPSTKARIKIALSKEGDQAKIEFCDNGPGIDKAILKRIFEPFYSTKTDAKGTGLGLSVSYFIVTEQLQGSLQVNSMVGEGSCFIILLPLEATSNNLDDASH